MTGDLTLDDTVEGMATRVLAAAPPRFTLVGLSMGGYVALQVMRQAPHRVARLALFSTSARPDSEDRAEQRREAIRSLPAGRFIGVSRSMLPRLLHPVSLGGTAAEEVRSMAARVGEAAFRRQQNAILSRPDFRDVLQTVRVPTLVGVGDCDLITPPAEALFIHGGIARSSFHLFHECGHLPPIERPDEMTGILRDWMMSEAQAA
ncbi:alpha/beta fold hydrolase [Rhizobium sp. RAF36]|uniref:alpha/beta fold hydrolase n=1 Tax=Rhizobium sp. RAF36 TaxID=3233055 RepID=UPI003F9CCC50